MRSALPATADATTFTVSTSADSNSGTCAVGSCTLRQAVNAVNGGAGTGDTIKVPAGSYVLGFGELQLLKPVTIEGAGSSTTIVDGGKASRVFNVPNVGVVVRLSGLAVAHGKVAGTGANLAKGAGIRNSGALTLDNVVVRENLVLPADASGSITEGGGIYNDGSLHISGSTIEKNEATVLPLGGGIASGAGLSNFGGRVDITDSVVSANVVSANAIPEGGGIYSAASAAHGSSVTLTRVRVEGNRGLDPSAGGVVEGAGVLAFRTDLAVRESAIVGNEGIGGAIATGGGVYFTREGNLLLERSLVANNFVAASAYAEGGGLSVASGKVADLLEVADSTIAGNRAVAPTGATGGGVFHSGGSKLQILSATIATNSVSGSTIGSKGGNLEEAAQEGGFTSLRDSIVVAGVGESGFENCAGGTGTTFSSAGHNIESRDQCGLHAAGDKVNTDPLLGPLAANGGPTQTMALFVGSPAIDAGDSSCPATDQRGVARPQQAACDIGAFEYVPPPPPSPTSGPAKIKFLSGVVSIGLKNGKGTARVKCLNLATDSCAVTLTLWAPSPQPSRPAAKRKSKVRIGSAKGTIAGQKTGKLKVKLNAKGLALLGAQPNGKLPGVKASGKSRNKAKQATAIKHKLALKVKAPKRH